MATSTEVALSHAVLSFVRKQVTHPRARHGGDPERALSRAVALSESIVRFQLSCNKPMTTKAIAKLTCFLRITIGDLIDEGRMGWVTDPSRRDFVLECAKKMGEFASTRAASQATITPRILELAAGDMIPVQKPKCTLPDHGELHVLGSSCTRLADEISDTLKEKQCP